MYGNFRAWCDHPDTEAIVARWEATGTLTSALNWYRAMDGSALDGLNPVCVPTLYVWSTGDVAFGWAAAQNTAECVQGPYTFEVLDNVSHWIPEMAPVELSQLLIRHLKAN